MFEYRSSFKITHLKKSYIYRLESKILGPFCEAQKMLIEKKYIMYNTMVC